MTRAHARQLNYQVKSFLVVHTNPSQNWMLLNYGAEQSLVGSYHVVIKTRFSIRVSTHTLYYQQSTKNKNRIDLKFPKKTLGLAVPPSSLLVEYVFSLMCRIAGCSV
jgi:hypothetical protein